MSGPAQGRIGRVSRGGGRGGRAALPVGRGSAGNRGAATTKPNAGFVDLFGGAGGMSLGFKMAGFRPLATLDSFGPGNDTYRRNFTGVPPGNVVCADAGAPGAIEEFVAATGLKRGDARVVIGGPPCQGFSVAGRVKLASLGNVGGARANPRFIDDPRNLLYKSFIKFIERIGPDVVVMENVTGMISYKNGDVVKEIERNLAELGYTNCDHRVLNAADYGVPQMRNRVFFMATKRGLTVSWPKPTHVQKTRSATIDTAKPPKYHVTAWDAIRDLPRIERPPKNSKAKDLQLKYSKPASCDFQRRMRGSMIKVGNNATRWHRKKDLEVFDNMEPGDRWADLTPGDKRKIGYNDDSFNDKWRRLPLNRPSWTVTSHLSKDGYMFIHPKQNRTISVREAARLQSFPDRFVFEGSRSSQFKQIGNAVPPLLARAIARSVRRILS